MAESKRLELARREVGDGPPIVFLHGIGGSSRVWAPIVPELGGYLLLSYDLPGHGQSPFPEEALLDSLDGLAEVVQLELRQQDLGPAALCGHSAGALIAVMVALADPSAVSRLVVISSDAGHAAFSWLADGAVADLAAASGMDAVFDFALEHDPTMAEVRGDPKQVDAYRRAFVGTDPRGFASLARALARRPDLVPALAGLSCPVLAICGSRDADFREPTRTIANVTGGRYVEIPRAGHLPMIDAPERVAREIRAHLSEPIEDGLTRNRPDAV